MVAWLLFIRICFASVKRKHSSSDSTEIELKDKKQTKQEVEVAQALLELGHNTKTTTLVIKRTKNLLSEPDIQLNKDQRQNNRLNDSLITQNQEKIENSCQDKLHIAKRYKKMKIENEMVLELEKEFELLKNKYNKNLQIWKQCQLEETVLCVESNELNLNKLNLEFESKMYFFLVDLYLNLIDPFAYISQVDCHVKEFELDQIVPVIYTQLITQSDLNDFYVNEENNENILNSDLKIINEKYIKLQEKIRSFFAGLKTDVDRLKVYLVQNYINLVHTFRSKFKIEHSDLFFKFSVKDFFSFNDMPSFRFLFPEYQMILNLIDKDNATYFIKRLHFFGMTFYFKFLVLKDIMLIEIKNCYEKEKKIDILKCKTFAYFLFHAKMTIQVLLTNYYEFIAPEYNKFSYYNFLFYLKVTNPCLRSNLNFNTFFLINFPDIRTIPREFEQNIIISELNARYFSKKMIKIISFPSVSKINCSFKNKMQYALLINKILKETGEKADELNYSVLTDKQIEEIFCIKFMKMVNKDFS
ncbi:hypothetical protein TUBRATIS_000150 [Tubulinosema ratisbonensis]|uniref:Uncharacterized protein n=1 Tax=Tubulinosema ratisbonensis TaxID=291195 RepID=A0A437AR35_9MICR|nr:hypothetical protein TUBRATIS_000150 [Tubulinosema ratisbonensis]